MRYDIKKLFLVLSILFYLNIGSAVEISIKDKLEYGAKINEAFTWQSVGQSTIAFAMFDQGYQAALKAGESAKKTEPIRQLFFWYRTYGRHLGITAPPVHDYDKIVGEYSYQPRITKPVSQHPINPQQQRRNREFLMGCSEVVSGLLCVWIVPSPSGKKISGMIAVDGVKRLWVLFQEVKTEKDFALLELKRVTESINEAAKN